MKRFSFVVGVMVTIALSGKFFGIGDVAFAVGEKPGEQSVDYARDIKPILSSRCYTCHGPDEEAREAELRLDRREDAIKEAITPGKSANSELILRLTHSDPDERMPPSDSNKQPLTKAEVDLIRRWIDQGARFDLHWSYLSVERPAVPKAESESWGRGDIDRFVATRYKQHGLKPSPEADRRILIRRLSFDLTGLPPKSAEAVAFEADKSPQAYEHLVDRLMASRHYGERMAMMWLDLVRYADTNGIHGDNHREHSPFRDYVINAFNDNKPFDTFTIEQLSGDLLEKPTPQQRIASGYNRLNMTTREGGAQAKEYRAKYAADRVRNASAVWLGSTMGCCECHDHKYDPFTMRDFYSLAAFFADIQETAVGVQAPSRMPTAIQQAKIDQLTQQIAKAQQTANTPTPQLEAAQAQWEKSLGAMNSKWTVLKPIEMKSKGGATLAMQTDGSILVSGANPAVDDLTLSFSPQKENITAIRLEILPDKSLPAQGPGRSTNGNFVLHEVQLAFDGKPAKWAAVSATHSQKGFPIAATIDGKPNTGWAILPQVGKASEAVFETDAKFSTNSQTRLTLTLTQNYGTSHTLGHFRISATTAKRPLRAGNEGGLPKKIAAIVSVDPAKRNDRQKQTLAAHYRGIASLLSATRKEITRHTAEKVMIEKAAPLILVATSIKPRMMRILPRGNWLDDSGEEVQPAVPLFLAIASVKDRRSTRLDLAKWFVDPNNPLVARVFVNRLWKILFVRGIVKTMDDYGAQGDVPTHPELLDHLATDFVASGWDVKRVLKSILMSSTYRQSSFADQAARDRDPANDQLARQGRFRMDAEMVRDNALAVSGLLVRTIGGRSVKPYQPLGYWSHLNFPKRVYKHDSGNSQYRRGLYTYWCRTFLHPSLLAFNAPTREECTAERIRSNTPLQALVLLNDPTYVEAARTFAGRMIAEGGDNTAQRIGFAFREALGREPLAQELAVLSRLLDRHRQQYQADPEAAKKLLGVGLAKTSKDADAIELAAWTSVARVIFNLHETVTRQ